MNAHDNSCLCGKRAPIASSLIDEEGQIPVSAREEEHVHIPRSDDGLRVAGIATVGKDRREELPLWVERRVVERRKEGWVTVAEVGAVDGELDV